MSTLHGNFLTCENLLCQDKGCVYLAQVDYDRIYLRDDDGNHFEAAIAEPSLLRMVIDDA